MTDDSTRDLHVMGEHWLSDLSSTTELGKLVGLAKDHNDPSSSAELCRLLGEYVSARTPLAAYAGVSAEAVLVAAVPPNPTVHDHLAPRLAEAVASALGLLVDPDLIIRRHPTVRLRDTQPSDRRATAALAGYEVTRPVGDAAVILVDDVIMTGTTVGLIADLLLAAGAARVEVVVATRTRRVAR